MRTILLDTGPLGLVTNPSGGSQTVECGRWLMDRVSDGSTAVVPELADYELRRELIRAGKTRGVARLDELILEVRYLPPVAGDVLDPGWRC